MSSNNQYYYSTSLSPVSSYSGLSWTSAKAKPEELEEAEDLGEETVDIADLSNDLVSQIESEESSTVSEESSTSEGSAIDAGSSDEPSSTSESESSSGDSDSGGDSGGDGGGGGD